MPETAASLPDGPLVLVGMMGSGKSSVGRRLAERCDRPFVDLDELVEERLGATVAEVFDRHGEATFRAAERQALADVLADGRNAVVATGGGVVTDATNRALLEREGLAVWLRAQVPTLVARLDGDPADRPLLRPDPTAGGNGAAPGTRAEPTSPVEPAVARLAAEREVLYHSVAAAVVDTDGLEVDDVVDRILRLGVVQP
ncbi:MAG: shikimate kinase [Acidimicrobiia bacterium]|nr:shikimate kinase [Acidimicrobiia bacterium]